MILQNFIDYFRNIAETLIDISHSPQNKKFATLNIEEVVGGLRTKIDTRTPCLFLTAYEGNIEYSDADDPVRNFAGIGFLVAQYIDISDFRQEDDRTENLQRLGFKILSRLFKDQAAHAAGEFCPAPIFIIRDIDYSKVGPLHDNIYGFLFNITIETDISELVKYREEDWNEF